MARNRLPAPFGVPPSGGNAKQGAATRTCKPVENHYSRRMAKKAAAQNGRADLPVSQDAPQRVPTTKKENSLAPSDVPRPRERERVAQPGEGREGNNKSGRPSSLLDTRVIYCGDNLEHLKRSGQVCGGLPTRRYEAGESSAVP
jgi:hypothetical protein